MKVKFFYRDGDNYKCVWIQDVDDEVWNDFKKTIESDGEKLEEYLDEDCKSGNLFHLQEDFGLDMNIIPLIQQYGKSDMDHPYVSIIEYGDHLV